LWQETIDPTCKTAVNWVTKPIGRFTRRKALERWETKITNTEVKPQSIWPIAKSLMKRDGPKAPTAIRGPLCFIFHPLETTNAITDCLEKQFTSHDLCDENRKRRVETVLQALLETVENNPPETIRPCDLQKISKLPENKKGMRD
jgi:hypothetical protein